MAYSMHRREGGRVFLAFCGTNPFGPGLDPRLRHEAP